jgi:hypothetical protein
LVKIEKEVNMFKINGIVYQIVKTWVFDGEDDNDPRDGMNCIQLKSLCGRYEIITDSESVSDFLA